MNALLHNVKAASWLMRSPLNPARPQSVAFKGPRNSSVRTFSAKPAPYPPKTLHLKSQKGGRSRGRVMVSKLAFGTYGLKVLTPGRISYQTLEAGRRVLSRKTKGHGAQMWVRAFATIPITKKPLEVRMGKGKGPVSGYIARLKAGHMLYEVDGLSSVAAKQALTQAGHKIGIKTKIVTWT